MPKIKGIPDNYRNTLQTEKSQKITICDLTYHNHRQNKSSS